MADSVDLGSVYASLELKTQGFESGIASASSAMGGLQQTILGVFGGNLLYSAVTKATSYVLGFGQSAITSAASYETAMNVLQSVTGATGKEMEVFSKRAIELGKDITLPAVSASDAALAMTELAKAGLSMNDTIGASKGVLQAAAAGNIAVEESARLVASALMSFGLAGTESTRVADLLASAANASSLELGEVGLGLQQVGAQARLSGVPIEQTVGMLAQLANNGISAQQAGTSLSYMLRQLTAPTIKSKKLMGELGLSVYDSSGKFVGMREAIARLNVATAGMSQEQKAAALNVLFGAEAMKGASVIMADGVAGFDKMQQAMSRTGAASELAGARAKGLNGVMQAIGSQMETLQLVIGKKVLPALTLVGGFVADNFIPVMSALGVVLGVGLTVGLVAATRAMWSFTLALLANPMTAIIVLVTALAAALVFLQVKFNILGKYTDDIKDAFDAVKDAGKRLWEWFDAKLLPTIIKIGSAMFDLYKTLYKTLVNVMGDIWKDLTVAFKHLKDAFDTLSEAFGPLTQYIRDNWNWVSKLAGAFALLFTPVGHAILVIKLLNPVLQFVGATIGFVALAISQLVSWTASIIKFMMDWRYVLYILIGPLGVVLAAIELTLKVIGYFNKDASEASKQARELGDAMKNAGSGADGLKVSLSGIDTAGAGSASGKKFSTAFSSTFGDITSSLTGTLTVDTDPLATKLAISLASSMKKANIAQTVIDSINTQKIIDSAAQPVREYTAQWVDGLKTGFTKLKLSDELKKELINAGQLTKADAGLVGQAAADNIYLKFKSKLEQAGFSSATASEIAKSAPAVQLASGKLGADTATRFQKALEEALIAGGADASMARAFAGNPELLNTMMGDLATQAAQATGKSFEETINSPEFKPSNLLLKAMSSEPLAVEGLGVQTGNAFTKGFTGSLQGQNTGNSLGGSLITSVQNAGSLASGVAQIQGNEVGFNLGSGVISGVATGASKLPLTINTQLESAKTVTVTTAKDQGNIVGLSMGTGIVLGTKAGTTPMTPTVNTILQNAKQQTTGNANVQGTQVGTSMGMGMSSGVKLQGGNVQTTTQSVVNSSVKVDTSGATAIGKGIAQGAAKGVDNNQGGLFSSVQRMASNAINWAKDLLGIKSPSKVFMDIGKNVMLGLSGGVDKYASTFIDSITSVTDAAMAIGTDMGQVFPSQVAPSQFSSRASGSMPSNSLAIYGDINIQNQQDADYLLQRLSHRQDLTMQGLVGV